MESLNYLTIALGLMVVLYGFYRHYFLAKPKPKEPKHHSNFTLKIEPEL